MGGHIIDAGLIVLDYFSQMVAACLDDGRGDATTRGDGIEGRMPCEPSHPVQKRRGIRVVIECGHNLLGRMFHTIRSIARIDARDVKRRLALSRAACGYKFLCAQERAF